MKNNKIIVALFVGAISANQIPNINMIGAGIAHNDLVQVVNDTEQAQEYLGYALHDSNEGKNLQSAFQIWAETQEAKDFLLVAEHFPKSKEGKPIFDELEAAGNVVETHGVLGEKDGQHYAYLDNNQFAQVGHHVEQAGHHFDALKGTDYGEALPYLFDKSFETPEGKQLERFGGYFVESDAVQASGWHAEHAFNTTVEKGYLFDVPEGLKQDLQGAGLNVFKQKSPMMNMQAQKREQLLNRISVVEKRLKQLEGQKTKAESKINPVSFQVGPNRVDTFVRGFDNGLWHQSQINGQWSGWENLGGGLASEPAVISRGQNHIGVYVRGSDDALWLKILRGESWGDWYSLGGVLTSEPAVVSWGPDRVDAFVRGTDNALWQKSWDGKSWSDWVSHGGVLTSAPTVSSKRPNQLDVFVKGTDEGLWHKTWDGRSWSDWNSLGGILTSDPVVISEPNHVNVFVRGSDNALWHKWQDNGKWSGWESLGGVLTSEPAVVSWGPDRVDAFVRGTDNALWQKSWVGDRWTDWVSHGGVLTSEPEVSSQRPNQLDVFVKGTDEGLWHKTWDGRSWSDWNSLGGTLTSSVTAI